MSMIADLPKSELHVHLEGSIEDPDGYRFQDFAGFLECFKRASGTLSSPGDYALVTRQLLKRLEAQNVRYAEITLSTGVVLWKKQDFAAVYDAVRAASLESPVRVYWILDAIRHFGSEHAMEVARLAAERVNDGVVAFGIGGDEVRGPAGWFAEVFAWARAQGLRLTAHAGETAGPESIWAALEIGAERIGHGFRAIDDPALVAYLRDRRIPLEVCLSSNVATGVVPRLEDHPVRRLYDAGVPIVLNTDDPAIFHTTLIREYELSRDVLGFSERELNGIRENGFIYAFREGLSLLGD